MTFCLSFCSYLWKMVKPLLIQIIGFKEVIMKKSYITGSFCAAIFCFIAQSSQAALISVLGGQAYYDDVADLTWLTNSNASGTIMNWWQANDWAADLNINGVTGWRLPASDVTCSNLNCTSSELGNMFYNVLGGVAGQKVITTHNSNYYLFSITPGPYWSSTEWALDNRRAWGFHFSNGTQEISLKDGAFYAWAVRSGNAGMVPVPAAVWLFCSGLLVLMSLSTRMNH